jgi:osmotically-inducible protein OsmY
MTDSQRPTDEALKEAVVAAIGRLGTVDGTRIGVSVAGGAVTLSGEVESHPEKLLAEQAALQVPGVTVVAEGLDVRSSFGGTSDTDIARAAVEALRESAGLAGGHVSATVEDHVVTLTGYLPRVVQRTAAVAAVAGLKGVGGVRDEITVGPRPPAARR